MVAVKGVPDSDCVLQLAMAVLYVLAVRMTHSYVMVRGCGHIVSILCVVVVSSLQYSEWSEWSSPSITLCGVGPNRTRVRSCQPLGQQLAAADYYCSVQCNSSQTESQCASGM